MQHTCRPLRCQMQMEWSSEPLMSHLPFLSVTLKVEKTQCFSFTWPAQKGSRSDGCPTDKDSVTHPCGTSFQKSVR